jgi:MFS family permease
MDRVGTNTAAELHIQHRPLILLRLVDDNSIGQKMLLGTLLAVLATPGAQFEIPMWAEVVKCTEIRVTANPRQYSADGAVGQAYGLLNFFYAMGVTVGPLLSGFICEATGWGTTVLVLGILSAISTISTFLCTGGYKWKKQNIQPHIVMEIASRG